MPASDRTGVCAAASSMASGMPSSRSHIVAASAESASLQSLAPRSRDRCANSSTASAFSPRPSTTGSGSSGITRSPEIPSRSREVASTRRRAALERIASTSWPHASTRCSQLSSTRSASRCERWAASSSSTVLAPNCGTCSACATAPGTAAGSETESSSTNQHPSRNRLSALAAASAASLVLPMPPGPVMVTRRAVPSTPTTVSSSRDRPTRELRKRGSVPRTGWPPGEGCVSWG